MSELQTVFKKVDYTLDALLHYIDIGDIGLPDIQRPFVWSATKVRDLFDSMYRGFPVGYFLFWQNSGGNGAKAIGTDTKGHKIPNLLIVDGQQRLTSLYSVFRGKPVLDDDYKEVRVEIAFRPSDGRFEVADAAVRRDPEWVPDIARLWSENTGSFKAISGFLGKLEQKRDISDQERESIAHNLDKLFDVRKYPFTALEIAPTVDEEQVADIFVRINSEGVKLNQADFILTLLSVFWEEGRIALELFSRGSRKPPYPGSPASAFNHFIQPGPDQMLRVNVALGFYRARLKSVYQILRGKDPDTGVVSLEKRDEQFKRLEQSQGTALDLTHWHSFLSALVGAGFRSSDQISSEAALLYAYAFYLIGKTHCGLKEHVLQRLIGRWFYASTLEGRYSGSPETVMEQDLNRVKGVTDGTLFVNALQQVIDGILTHDFWEITLPGGLATSSARSPELFAYYAAQNLLGAPVLFSNKKIGDMLDPTIKPKKKALDRHHLFPRAYLDSLGITDIKIVNQAANYALLEWPDNIDISDTSPSEYVPTMRRRFAATDWARMCELHALPEGWEQLSYEDFLVRRRLLMARIIRRGYEGLA